MKQPIPVVVPAAPPQNDTYSQAVWLGDVIYVSGQLGVRPDKGARIEIEAIAGAES